MKDEITEAVMIAVTKNVREFLAIQKSSSLKERQYSSCYCTMRS